MSDSSKPLSELDLLRIQAKLLGFDVEERSMPAATIDGVPLTYHWLQTRHTQEFGSAYGSTIEEAYRQLLK